MLITGILPFSLFLVAFRLSEKSDVLLAYLLFTAYYLLNNFHDKFLVFFNILPYHLKYSWNKEITEKVTDEWVRESIDRKKPQLKHKEDDCCQVWKFQVCWLDDKDRKIGKPLRLWLKYIYIKSECSARLAPHYISASFLPQAGQHLSPTV